MDGIDGGSVVLWQWGVDVIKLYCKITLAYDMPGCRINARESRHWVNLNKPTFAFSPIILGCVSCGMCRNSP